MNELLSRLASTLGRRQAGLELKWMRQSASTRSGLLLSQMVERRTRGEPLQYILGNQPFGPLDIIVRRPVLIPRPETEQWTYTLADRIIHRLSPLNHPPKTLAALDICTGTACIPLLLCTLLTPSGIQTEALGVDISSTACLLAQDNIMSSRPRFSPLSSVHILQKDLFEHDFWSAVHSAFSLSNVKKVLPKLDLITANPPYLTTEAWQRLAPEVKLWEDPVALLGDPAAASEHDNFKAANFTNTSTHGHDGLHFYRRIHNLTSSCANLSPSCILALEIGENQASAVVDLFRTQFRHIEVWKDAWGKDRAVYCTMKQYERIPDTHQHFVPFRR